MSAVVLKWNPSFSSYTMLRYLEDLYYCNEEGLQSFNWSVWDHDKIHAGDRYYWVKLGYGAVGVVSAGIITSEPYLSRDWSGSDRKIYYVDFEPEVLINPDTLPILTSEELSKAIPSFDWFKGHSGLVLDPVTAAQTEETWQLFLHRYEAYFRKARQNHPLDQLFMLNDDDE